MQKGIAGFYSTYIQITLIHVLTSTLTNLIIVASTVFIWIEATHWIVYSRTCNLMPRSHPQGGKRGLVNLDTILGQGKGIWAVQWDCSFSTVIWLANHRNEKCIYLLYKFELSARAHPALLTKVYFITAVSVHAHRTSQTKETVEIYQTSFPSMRVRSGHKTTAPGAQQKK